MSEDTKSSGAIRQEIVAGLSELAIRAFAMAAMEQSCPRADSDQSDQSIHDEVERGTAYRRIRNEVEDVFTGIIPQPNDELVSETQDPERLDDERDQREMATTRLAALLGLIQDSDVVRRALLNAIKTHPEPAVREAAVYGLAAHMDKSTAREFRFLLGSDLTLPHGLRTALTNALDA